MRSKKWERTMIVVGVTVVACFGVAGSAGAGSMAPAVHLHLWNQLGSDFQVTHSVVGAPFTIHRDGTGERKYVSGKVGDALATTGGGGGGGGYLEMSPDNFFGAGADKRHGAVEVWIQKRIPTLTPFVTGLVTVFGQQKYDAAQCGNPRGCSYEPISAYWSDGFTGGGGLEFNVVDANDVVHSVNDLGFDDVSVGTWVQMAFVWDLDGVNGTTDTLRMYRDGTLVASSQTPIPSLLADSKPVKVLAHHAYSRVGQPLAYLDELRVWTNYDVTPPTCAVTLREKWNVHVSVQDAESGIASIASTNVTNATVTVAPFTPATTSPVKVKVTRLLWAKRTATIVVTDVAGNSTTCPVSAGGSQLPIDPRARSLVST